MKIPLDEYIDAEIADMYYQAVADDRPEDAAKYADEAARRGMLL
jgi:hypothetical protein